MVEFAFFVTWSACLLQDRSLLLCLCLNVQLLVVYGVVRTEGPLFVGDTVPCPTLATSNSKPKVATSGWKRSWKGMASRLV